MKTKKDVLEAGKDRGESVGLAMDIEVGKAIWNPDADYHTQRVTKKNVKEIFMSECHDAEHHSRQYAPFDQTATALNRLEADGSTRFDPWEVFEEGLQAGFRSAWNARKGEYL